jgi:hypothetical protein
LGCLLISTSIQIVTSIFLLGIADHQQLLFPFIFLKKKENNPVIITLFFTSCISLVVLALPIIGFFIAIISAVIFLLQPASYYVPKIPSSALLTHFVIFLHNSRIIYYFSSIYNFFFNKDYNIFRVYIVILNSFIVLYTLSSRYYFVYNVFSIPLFFCLFFGLLALYLRTIVNIYVYITNYVLNDPTLRNLFNGDELPPQQSNKPFIDFSRKSYHYNEIPPQKWYFSRKAGIVASFITCGAACYAAYYAKLSAEYAKLSVDHAEVQNKQFQQQNDLEALSQQLITKEQFCALQPRYCLKDNAATIAATLEASKKAGVPGIKSTAD